MDHSHNKFETAEELLGFLSVGAPDREYRARLVMEYGTESQKIDVLCRCLEHLRRPWRHQGDETDWRSEIVLENEELLIKHDFLKPRKSLPIPKKVTPEVTEEEKEVLTKPAKPKKPRKPKTSD